MSQKLTPILFLFLLIFSFSSLLPAISAESVINKADSAEQSQCVNNQNIPPIKNLFENLAKSTGIAGFINNDQNVWTDGPGRLVMILIGFGLLYLRIAKRFEPLLLVTISFSCILSNIPQAGINEPGGIIYYIYEIGIRTGVFPLIIFMGVGALTTPEEIKIRMQQLRPVSRNEKIIFPLTTLTLCIILLPSAAPLIGFFMFGNLMKECGVVDRLSFTVRSSLINITTIFLGLGVGSKLSAAQFLTIETLGILVLGIIAFSMGHPAG